MRGIYHFLYLTILFEVFYFFFFLLLLFIKDDNVLYSVHKSACTMQLGAASIQKVSSSLCDLPWLNSMTDFVARLFNTFENFFFLFLMRWKLFCWSPCIRVLYHPEINFYRRKKETLTLTMYTTHCWSPLLLFRWCPISLLNLTAENLHDNSFYHSKLDTWSFKKIKNTLIILV